MIARNGCSASRGTGAQLPWNAQPGTSGSWREPRPPCVGPLRDQSRSRPWCFGQCHIFQLHPRDRRAPQSGIAPRCTPPTLTPRSRTKRTASILNSRLNFRLCIAPSGSPKHLSRFHATGSRPRWAVPSTIARQGRGTGLASIRPRCSSAERQAGKAHGAGQGLRLGTAEPWQPFPGRQGRNGHKLERVPFFWLARSGPRLDP